MSLYGLWLKNVLSSDYMDSPGSEPAERPCWWTRCRRPCRDLTFFLSGNLFPDFVTQPRQSVLKAVKQKDSAANADRNGHAYS